MRELELIRSIQDKIQFREETYLKKYSLEELTLLKDRGVIDKTYGLSENYYSYPIEKLEIIYNRLDSKTYFFVARKYVKDSIRKNLTLKYFKPILDNPVEIPNLSGLYESMFKEKITVNMLLNLLINTINEDVLLVDFCIDYITKYKKQCKSPTNIDYMIEKIVFLIKNYESIKNSEAIDLYYKKEGVTNEQRCFILG